MNACLIRAVAIDDEAPTLRVITRFCTEVPYLSLERAFQKPQEALDWVQKHPVDLVFLDIRLTEVQKSLPPGTLIIFTTNYSDYAVGNATDYLVKPFAFDRFLQATAKALDSMWQRTPCRDTAPEALVLRGDDGQVPVPLSDILYVEASDDYTRIYLADKKPLVVRASLKRLLTRLPPQGFLRVNRSFIVPLSRVENVRHKIITVAGKEIPIESAYERAFVEHFGQ